MTILYNLHEACMTKMNKKGLEVNMNNVTEIVSFEINDGIDYEAFTNIVDQLEREYHSKQPGFIDTELLYDSKNNTWLMLQHWESMIELKNASKQMFKEKCTEEFRAALNEKSVKIHAYPQIKTWHI